MIVMVVIAAACLPFARHPLPVIPVFLPMVGAIAAVAQLLTSALLYNRYRKTGMPSDAILALLFGSSLITSLAFLISLPDVTPLTGILHPAARLASWYYLVGSGVFVAQIVALVRSDDAERRNRQATSRQMFVRTLVGTFLVIVACALTGPAIASPLAKVFASKTFGLIRLYVIVPAIACAVVVAYAYVTSVFQRRLTMVRLWLGLVVLATFFQLLISTEYATSRFSIGWVVVLGFWIVASALFLITMIVNHFDTISIISLRNEALYEQSCSDELTGLLNRRGFNQRFEDQFRRSSRTEEALGVLLIDMDDFKRYNDTFGHQSGDRAIASVARVIAMELKRSRDAGARIGGDEFAVLLPKTDMAGAHVRRRTHSQQRRKARDGAGRRRALSADHGDDRRDLGQPAQLTARRIADRGRDRGAPRSRRRGTLRREGRRPQLRPVPSATGRAAERAHRLGSAAGQRGSTTTETFSRPWWSSNNHTSQEPAFIGEMIRWAGSPRLRGSGVAVTVVAQWRS